MQYVKKVSDHDKEIQQSQIASSQESAVGNYICHDRSECTQLQTYAVLQHFHMCIFYLVLHFKNIFDKKNKTFFL